MSEKNCRTPAQLDAETLRLCAILEEDARTESGKFGDAARHACDATLGRVIEQVADGPLAEPWVGTIRGILELRKRERAAKG